MRELPDPQHAKPCVLVVDDDHAVGWSITARLGRNFRVVALPDPALAVERAVQERADLILCDINMPGMKGDEVAYALSQDARTARIPLVYLTALVGPEDPPDLGGAFGDHLAISKSASSGELRELVATLLGLARD
jgi:CheY-like chemotaxis protein